MTIPGIDTLLIEQPWTFARHLWGSRYQVDVYDERGVPVASVTERRGPGPLRRLLRATGFSGRTGYDLVLSQQGRPTLLVRKGMGRPPLQVCLPDGTPIGSLRQEGRGHYALRDTAGQRLCHLHEVAGFRPGTITKRDGRRVRRDVVRIRPGTPEPLRSLVIAACVSYDVVRGVGTGHSSGGGFDLPGLE